MKTIIFISLFVSSTTFANDSDTSVECNFETIKKFCEKMKEKEKTQLRSKSPYKFSNGQQMPSIDSLSGRSIDEQGNGPKVPWRDMKRFIKLFGEMKKYAAETILQGRDKSQLSSEEKNMLERVETIRLSDLSNKADQATCDTKGYFGYNPNTHSLIVCPEMAGYPDSALIWAMGAFTGRGLGNCVPQLLSIKNPAKKIDIRTFDPDHHPYDQFCHAGGCRKAQKGQGLMNCLRDGGFSDGDKDINYSTPDAQKLIENQIKFAHWKANSPSLDLTFIPNSKDKIEVALKDPANIAWAKGEIEDKKYCYKGVTNATLDSGIQDWFGTDVTNRYLQDHPLNAKTPEDNLQPLATMIDFTCRMPEADEITRVTHAPTETRFNSAIFTHEGFRKTLNCSPAKSIKKNCSVSTAHWKNGRSVAPSDSSTTRSMGQ